MAWKILGSSGRGQNKSASPPSTGSHCY